MRNSPSIGARTQATARWVGVGTLALASAMVGCRGPRFEHQPPVVSTSVFADKGTGNAIAIANGDRLLTVAHGLGLDEPEGLARLDGAFPAVVRGASGGGWVGLSLVDHGDLGALAPLGEEPGFDAFAHDWAIARAEHEVLEAPPWRIGAWPPAWGEVLYVVRPSEGMTQNEGEGRGHRRGGFHWVRMRVQRLARVDSREMPGSLGIGGSARDVLGPGWSGSFVGRYDNGWEFVALHAGAGEDVNGERFDIFVRPPDHALRWMMEAGPDSDPETKPEPEPDRE